MDRIILPDIPMLASQTLMIVHQYPVMDLFQPEVRSLGYLNRLPLIKAQKGSAISVEGKTILRKIAAIKGNPNAASAENLVIKPKSVG